MNINKLILTLVTFVLMGCSDIDPFGNQWIAGYYLNVDNTSVTLGPDGNASVYVTAPDDLGWRVDSSPSWIAIEGGGGTGNKKLSLSSKEDNPENLARKGNVVLRSLRYDKRVTFTVIQPGSFISLDVSSLTFQNSGGYQTVYVTSNCAWEVTSKPTWLTLDSYRGKTGTTALRLSATENSSEDSREGKVRLASSSGAITEAITVTQEEVILQVGESDLMFTSQKSSKTVSVKSNAQWDVQSSATWCTVSSASGSGNKDITISVSANDGNVSVQTRTAIVTVSSGKVRRSIQVTQTPDIRISLSVDKLEFEPEDGLTTTFKVTSNASQWSVSSNETWCSVRPQTGSNNNTVTVTVGSNTSAYAVYRTATVTVKSGPVEKTVVVNQKAPELSVNKESMSFGVNKGSESFEVSSNVSWSARSNASWCSVSTKKSASGGTVTVTVSANPNASNRSATVTVSGGGQTRTLTVNQKGEAKLELSRNVVVLNRQGSTETVSVTSNVNWTARSSESWCKVSSTSERISISASENPDVSSRSAIIAVSGGGIDKQIAVTQQGGVTLLVETPGMVSPAGGTQYIAVTSNVSWTVTSNSSWCVVTKQTNRIKIDVSSWQGTTERSATITVTGGDQTKEVVLKQAGNNNIDRNDFSGDIKL